MQYTIDVSDETANILLTLARGQLPPELELSDDVLVALAVDLLANSYDVVMPQAGGDDAEPVSAAELRNAISNSIDPDISLGEVEVRSAQGNLFSNKEELK